MWDFLRLQHRRHFKAESTTAAHCLKMNLGSLADTRLDETCTHQHPHPTISPAMPPIVSATSETCSESGCTKQSSSSCKHCSVSLCRKHLEARLCTCEDLPAADVFGEGFVCPTCRTRVDATTHTKEGCATCDELVFFKEDLIKCARRTECEDLIGQAQQVCQAIDVIIAHNARIVNQERFWPDALERMRQGKHPNPHPMHSPSPASSHTLTEKQYDHVLLKSDYWKKFEGTALKVNRNPHPHPTFMRVRVTQPPQPHSYRWGFVRPTQSKAWRPTPLGTYCRQKMRLGLTGMCSQPTTHMCRRTQTDFVGSWSSS